VVSGLCALFAVAVLAPHFRGAPAAADAAGIYQYWNKFQRLSAADVVRREFMATTSSGNFRQLDQAIAPDARVFASGLIGKENGRRLGNFFWAIYYLFPRHIAASLDVPPRFTSAGWLDGRDARSSEELLQRGYDLQLDFGVGKPEEEMMRFNPLRPERVSRKRPQ
jgi:hypothetical protein